LGYGAPTDERTSCICDHFGKAVEPTVDPGLLVEAQTYDEGGMPLIRPMVTAHSASYCLDGVGECSMNKGRMSYSLPFDVATGPVKDIMRENKEYGESGDRLSPGAAVVGGHKVHQSCNELQKDNETGDGTWLNRPASATVDDEKSEVGDEENCEKFEGEVGVDYEEFRSGNIGNTVDVTDDKDITDVQRKEILYKQSQTAPSENEFESSNEQGRPTRTTRKPSRLRDEEFGTQFRPQERRQRSYNNLGRRDQVRSVDNFRNFHKPRKKKTECNNSGRGDQKNVSHLFECRQTISIFSQPARSYDTEVVST